MKRMIARILGYLVLLGVIALFICPYVVLSREADSNVDIHALDAVYLAVAVGVVVLARFQRDHVLASVAMVATTFFLIMVLMRLAGR